MRGRDDQAAALAFDDEAATITNSDYGASSVVGMFVHLVPHPLWSIRLPGARGNGLKVLAS